VIQAIHALLGQQLGIEDIVKWYNKIDRGGMDIL